jgi:ribosomal protein S6
MRGQGPITLKKAQEFMQKSYELTVIFSGSLTPAEIEEQAKQVEALLVAAGAEIKFSHNLGRKKLAYKIKNFTHGEYRVWLFAADSKTAPLLNQKLRMSSFVVRHLIVGLPEAVLEKRIAKITEPKTAKPKEEREETRRVEKSEPIAPPVVAPPTVTEEIPARPIKETKKISLDDLDEKLDEILERDAI